MHVRIQGWIPYECQIYINGREWLARQLDKAGIGYVRYENSLVQIDDLEAAAELCERFAHRAWPRVLNAFARQLNPILPEIRAAGYGGYYWVLDQAEIATDIMFGSNAGSWSRCGGAAAARAHRSKRDRFGVLCHFDCRALERRQAFVAADAAGTQPPDPRARDRRATLCS